MGESSRTEFQSQIQNFEFFNFRVQGSKVSVTEAARWPARCAKAQSIE